MKLLLDECIDWRLTRSFVGIDIISTRQKGWSELKNGKLLQAAAHEFDVLISVDRNIEHQNNIPEIDIAVVVLLCRSNTLKQLQPLVPQVIEKLPTLKPGTVTFIGG